MATIFDAPFCVIADHPTWPAANLIREMVKRSMLQVFLITRAKQYSIPGTVADGDHVYVDGADRMTLPEIRHLSRTASRLVLGACPNSSIYKTLLTPTFSAPLAWIVPLPLDLVTHTARAYMLDVQDPVFWDFLQKTVARGAIANYMQGTSALAITIRTAAGGAKGTSRTIQAVDTSFEPIPMASIPSSVPTTDSSSFDIALTEDQRRRRDAVPIPYVHEGEGVDLGLDEEDDEEI